jgi:hypothetical protein
MANEFKHKDPGTALTQAEFIASDGTGHIFDSQAAGDILYASSTTVLARLAKATDGNVLELASGLPAWTASPTIGSTSWANANHAHAGSNSGGTLTTLGTVTTGVWQGTAIASGYIAADAITGAKIADDAVDSEHYTDGSIDNAHLADDAVDSDEIAAGAIDTAHIADNQVTLAKIADIARGSVIVGNASAATAELTIGSNTYVLTSDGTDIAWAAGGSEVVDDASPQLGGNLDMQARLLVGNGGSTGIAISANGEVTMAAQPGVLAKKSASNNNVTGNGTLVELAFDTEVFDQNGDFATPTFTAPVTGRYYVSALVGLFGVTADATTVELYMTSSNLEYQIETGGIDGSAGGRTGLSFSLVIDMDAADTLVAKARVNGVGADSVDIIGGTGQTMFSAWLMG